MKRTLRWPKGIKTAGRMAALVAAAGVAFAAWGQIKPPASDFREEKIGIDMVFVKGGAFDMGCRADAHAADCWGDEKPVRKVTVSDFHIGKFPVTQRQWTAVMGSNPSKVKGDDMPVAPVSWDQAQEFVSKLNTMTGKKYRLPTEAEWEFAARGGLQSKGYKYAGSNGIHDVAWYADNSGNAIKAVGLKQANELGLYDMSGNVWEWTLDWVGSYGSIKQNDNPAGPVSGTHRIARGGSFRNEARRNRITNRGGDKLNVSFGDLGVRVVIGVDINTAGTGAGGGGGSFTDSRDGKTYRTVKIGNQTWMAENLNYNASGSVCYENKESNCNTYGRLYNWSTVMNRAKSSDKNPSGVQGICPVGWHVPSDAEWTALTDFVGGEKTAGTKLKSKTGWSTDKDYKAATDDYGFSALPGGSGHSNGDFRYAGGYGIWWSATENDANSRDMDYNNEAVNRNRYIKSSLLSLRCSQD
ncbi:MAG: SUMF1/EgtB/PvdO family nonheme iron enzyme [Chitinispirillia bacterium]|nr:SUMF1/EgtB/PvdO family nonheme iron enzyme [Chitinispirillia bacterium]MCL2242733.1 SUMF1/EgtB/PvdO family nonheme iron enzyme [Chitinispirillia bacterium]